MKTKIPFTWLQFFSAIVLCFLLFFSGSPEMASINDITPVIGFAAILPATALQKVNLLTEQAWSENQNSIEVNTVDDLSFQKQLMAQRQLGAPFIQPLTDPRKDHTDVKIWWPDFCGEEAIDCDVSGADLCGDLSGNAATVESEAYNITSCITDRFKISENTFAGSWLDFQRMLVQQQNQKIINIMNKLNEKYLLFLHANAGLNKGGQFSQDGMNRAEVDTSEFDKTLLITKMMLDAEKSNVRNSFMITGDNQMYLTYHNSLFQSGNADGKGDAARTNKFDITLDVRGFMKTPALEGATYMVAPYAAAFVSKNYYQSSAPVYDNDLGKWKYFITIPRYGVKIDVLHQRVCVDAAKDRYDHYFNYRLNYDFFLNPKGCLDEATQKRVTGILAYQNKGIDIGSS